VLVLENQSILRYNLIKSNFFANLKRGINSDHE
jgi:hypothetical protein